VRLNRNQSFLLVIDIQTRLAPAVHENQKVTARSIALVRVARLLGVPIVATEHCPERIGPIVPELRSLLADDEIVSKKHFSCADDPAILARLKALGRSQAVVAGMEAHVCAMQAALGLAEHGFAPLFAGDAAGSRHVADHAAALSRLRGEGIGIGSAEMAMFEWLGHADHAAFRDVLAIVKSL
jgi:nicotinamidase-related amidase